MHVQSCCIANINLLLFFRSRCRRRRRCLSSLLLIVVIQKFCFHGYVTRQTSPLHRSSHIIHKRSLTHTSVYSSLEHNPKMADQYQIASIIFNYYLSLSSLISCSTSTCAGCFLAEDLFGLFLFPPFSSSKNPASSSSSGTNSSIFVDECDHPFCGASIKLSKTSR